MQTHIIRLGTAAGPITDVTVEVCAFCKDQGDGLVNVFAPHSTVGLAIVQPDQGAADDVIAALKRLIPRDITYQHVEKAPGHGADHIIPMLASPSLMVPVLAGVPLLGMYQRIVFLDLDEQPSERRIMLAFVPTS
ncbi:MAG: YjbQ family protein [Dehalococcoidia bacterium]|nr:YjbQ family protein [Dehalococcoidia bacterium]